jgi:hypothetical protein
MTIIGAVLDMQYEFEGWIRYSKNYTGIPKYSMHFNDCYKDRMKFDYFDYNLSYFPEYKQYLYRRIKSAWEYDRYANFVRFTCDPKATAELLGEEIYEGYQI